MSSHGSPGHAAAAAAAARAPTLMTLRCDAHLCSPLLSRSSPHASLPLQSTLSALYPHPPSTLIAMARGRSSGGRSRSDDSPDARHSAAANGPPCRARVEAIVCCSVLTIVAMPPLGVRVLCALPLCSSPAPSRSYSSQTSTATRSNPTSANKPLAHPPAAASSAPHPAPHAAPQQHAPMQQQQQSGGGGMLSGLAGTVMSGMAFGTGRTNNSDPRAGRVCNVRRCSMLQCCRPVHRIANPSGRASFFSPFSTVVWAHFLTLSF